MDTSWSSGSGVPRWRKQPPARLQPPQSLGRSTADRFWLSSGLGLVAVGVALLSGAIWARIVGIGIAVLSAIAQFLSLPYYPVWAILVTALDVGVIWALTVHDPRAAR